MGGGNGQKSHMAREKKQAKLAAEKKGGGGKEGLKARTESQIGVSCALCRTPFTSVKMKTQLKDHWEGIMLVLCYGVCMHLMAPMLICL